MTVERDDTGEPLRILIVTQYFWPENFQINHLARALRQLGHEVTVLTGKPNYPSGRLFQGYSVFGNRLDSHEGIPIIRVPLLARGAGSGLRLALNYVSFMLAASTAAVTRVKGDFDVIFVYQPSPVTVGIPAIAAKWKKRVPILMWVQDLWPESVVAAGGVRSKLVYSILERLTRYIYRRCDKILVQSQAFRPSVEKVGADPERIVYLPQSVDALFRPIQPEEAHLPNVSLPDGFRVLFAGNVGHAQGLETLLEAAEILRKQPDIHWIVVGDGRRFEWLREQVRDRSLGDRIHLVGRYPENEMPHFFAHADALLVTLRQAPIFALTIPTKVQAYLASGRPIVAGLDGEGARIVSEAGAGETAPAGDAEALARAVLNLYRLTPAERSAMGFRAVTYSRTHFSRDRLVDELVKLMREVAPPRR